MVTAITTIPSSRVCRSGLFGWGVNMRGLAGWAAMKRKLALVSFTTGLPFNPRRDSQSLFLSPSMAANEGERYAKIFDRNVRHFCLWDETTFERRCCMLDGSINGGLNFRRARAARLESILDRG